MMEPLKYAPTPEIRLSYRVLAMVLAERLEVPLVVLVV
jgi:hypothetical protein